MGHYYDKTINRNEVQKMKESSLIEKNGCLERIEALKRVIKNEPVLEMTAKIQISKEQNRINKAEEKIKKYVEFLETGRESVHHIDL